MKKQVWLMMVACFYFLFPFILPPAEAASTDQRLEELESEVKQLQTAEQQYDFLKEEVKNFREFMQTQTKDYQDQIKAQQDNISSLVTHAFTIAGVILTAITVFLTWQWGQTRKEMNEIIELERKKLMEKLQKDLDQLREEMKQWIHGEKEQIEQRFTVMTEIIDREIQFRQTRILLVGADSSELIMNELDRELLQQQHIEVEPFLFKEDQFQKKLDQHSCDIVMYRYHPKPEPDETLQKVVTQLKEKDEFIPLVIYSKKHLKEEDKKQIDTYRWVWIANFYTTFINHIFTLSHAFSNMKKPEKGA